MNVMQQPGPHLFYGTVPGPPRSDGETFLGLHLFLAGRCCENPQSAMCPAQIKSGSAITWLVGVTIYCTIFQ